MTGTASRCGVSQPPRMSDSQRGPHGCRNPITTLTATLVPEPCSEPLALPAQDELARNVTLEQGKTLGDARGDVFRGLGAFFHPTDLT